MEILLMISLKYLAIFIIFAVVVNSDCLALDKAVENSTEPGNIYQSYLSSDFSDNNYLEIKINDPFETMNRVVFSFNASLDYALLRPAAFIYGQFTSNNVRGHVSSFLSNLNTPVTVANDLLQLNFKGAGVSLWRFMINTLLGAGGLMDVASTFGLKNHKDNFSKTLASYNLKGGPYLVLPIIGPSTVTDALGVAADYYVEYLTYNMKHSETGRNLYYSKDIISTVHKREEKYNLINDVLQNSLDPYVIVRSLYIQNRYNCK
jgi:phospholipid-binding lipoprotein MlaA